MSHTLRCFFVGTLAALLLISSCFAQSTFGSISGTVKDPSGSVVPGAAVEVVNEGTGTTRQSVSSSAGVFNVPNLDIGSYRVRVSGKGFTTYERSGVQLAANQVFNLDVQLNVGATTTVVEVQGVRGNTFSLRSPAPILPEPAPSAVFPIVSATAISPRAAL